VQRRRWGASQEELDEVEQILDPRHLLVGFGRRFAPYKRADLVMRELERFLLPADLAYHGTPGLSGELQEKLDAVKPTNLAQAGRIPGMTPAALSLLRIHARVRSAG
jgi:glucan phosphorylase